MERIEKFKELMSTLEELIDSFVKKEEVSEKKEKASWYLLERFLDTAIDEAVIERDFDLSEALSEVLSPEHSEALKDQLLEALDEEVAKKVTDYERPDAQVSPFKRNF